jgi:predicted TIM-barrel fold metal-dependent hydrolase
MKIIDFHTHLGVPCEEYIDPKLRLMKRLVRECSALVPDLLKEKAKAGSEALADIADIKFPGWEEIKEELVGTFGLFVHASKNRNIYLGELNRYMDGMLAPLVDFSMERATVDKLLADMETNGITMSVVQPVEPVYPTEDILRACEGRKNLIPFLSVKPGEKDIEGAIMDFCERGCRGIKIHPSIQNIHPDSRFHFEIAEVAGALKLPLLCHTGSVGHPAIRHPEYSRIQYYRKLVASFPKVTFVMAHMNMYDPEGAITFARRFENTLLDTSWQPRGVIRRALRQLGPSRLIFGSDWPIMGNPTRTQLEIVLSAMALSPGDLEKVFYRNAERLMKRSG